MEFFTDLLPKKKNIILFLCIVLTMLIISCKPTKNVSPPAYLKNIVVYKEGYDAIAAYFILADSSGAMTASDGLLTVNIEVKQKLALHKRLHDPIWVQLAEETIKEQGFEHKFNRLNELQKIIFIDEVIKGMMKLPGFKNKVEALEDTRKKIIDSYKATYERVPAEFLPQGSNYLKFIDIKKKNFQFTKVGIGAFEREALIYPVGRIPFSEFAPLFKDDDTGILKIEFETPDGKVFKGEETFYFK